MSIHESGEMYLEAILVLSQKNSFVRSIDVSEYLGYSKPSVSRAVGILKKGEYIVVDKDGSLTFTESGRTIAEKIFERHTVLSKLLTKMGVSEETATDADIAPEAVTAPEANAEAEAMDANETVYICIQMHADVFVKSPTSFIVCEIH